jgi:hypothetical protein
LCLAVLGSAACGGGGSEPFTVVEQSPPIVANGPTRTGTTTLWVSPCLSTSVRIAFGADGTCRQNQPGCQVANSAGTAPMDCTWQATFGGVNIFNAFPPFPGLNPFTGCLQSIGDTSGGIASGTMTGRVQPTGATCTFTLVTGTP